MSTPQITAKVTVQEGGIDVQVTLERVPASDTAPDGWGVKRIETRALGEVLSAVRSRIVTNALAQLKEGK